MAQLLESPLGVRGQRRRTGAEDGGGETVAGGEGGKGSGRGPKVGRGERVGALLTGD